MFVYCVTTTPFPARISITCANRGLHFDTAATTSDTCTHDRHHSPVGNLFDAVELKVDFVERLVALAKPLPHALVAVEDASHPLGRVLATRPPHPGTGSRPPLPQDSQASYA